MKQLSFCQHEHNRKKDCASKGCKEKADWQFRTYIRPGANREGSLAYSIYLCSDCCELFIKLMNNNNIKEDWNIKISMNFYKLKKVVNFE